MLVSSWKILALSMLRLNVAIRKSARGCSVVTLISCGLERWVSSGGPP